MAGTNGAALQLFSALRGEPWAHDSGSETLQRYEAFASLVLGRATPILDEPTAELVRRAAAESFRQDPDDRVAPYRAVYGALLSDSGVRSKRSRRGRRGSALALENLPRLKRQQRAALGLRCVLGFGDEEVASVLDVSPREAAIVVEAGIAAVRRYEGIVVQPPIEEPVVPPAVEQQLSADAQPERGVA